MTDPLAASSFSDASAEAATALAACSLAIVADVYRRYGRKPGRIAFLLWPWITLGAFLLGAPIFRLVRDACNPAVALVIVLALYAWLIAYAALLARPRLRSAKVRAFVVVPGTVLAAASLIAHPFAATAAVIRAFAVAHDRAPLPFGINAVELLPLAIALAGLPSSFRPRKETVLVAGSHAVPRHPRRVPFQRLLGRRGAVAPKSATALRIAQLSDVHLGGLVSIEALSAMVERLIARDPDLVLLTGDFLALEGMFSKGSLAAALAPLKAMQGRCFAVRGNHDYDALDEVDGALAENGIRLLVDESVVVATRLGPVQVLGVDHRDGVERKAHLRSAMRAMPRAPDARLSILLLHDPGRYHHLEPPWPDLVLSGHLHGGQVGLVFLGLPWTILTLTRLPDHGLFGFGTSRLYAHRGTGTFGFPLRLGIPAEESVLDYELGPAAAAGSMGA